MSEKLFEGWETGALGAGRMKRQPVRREQLNEGIDGQHQGIGGQRMDDQRINDQRVDGHRIDFDKGRIGGQRPGVLRRRLRRADFTAVADVRRDLRRLLAHWGESGRADIAELLISELVTNALVHTDKGALVTATVTDRLRVEVRDFVSRRPWPQPRKTAADGTSGRGLMLVHSLADAWGVRVHGVGKSVWFELGAGSTAPIPTR